MTPEPVPVCSFCEKSQREVRRLIMPRAGGVYICDECVMMSAQIILEEDREALRPPEGAICSTHPGMPAVAACLRCGAFTCAACARVGGRCGACDRRELPAVQPGKRARFINARVSVAVIFGELLILLWLLARIFGT